MLSLRLKLLYIQNNIHKFYFMLNYAIVFEYISFFEAAYVHRLFMAMRAWSSRGFASGHKSKRQKGILIGAKKWRWAEQYCVCSAIKGAQKNYGSRTIHMCKRYGNLRACYNKRNAIDLELNFLTVRRNYFFK